MKQVIIFFLLFPFFASAQSEGCSLKGEKFVFGPKIFTLLNDFVTDKTITYNYGDVWTVIAMKEVTPFGTPGVFLENKNRELILLGCPLLDRLLKTPRLAMTAKHFDGLEKKLGESNLKEIMKGNVVTGMTTDMVRFAWDRPMETLWTSETQPFERWKYPDGTYLFFKNNRVIKLPSVIYSSLRFTSPSMELTMSLLKKYLSKFPE